MPRSVRVRSIAALLGASIVACAGCASSDDMDALLAALPPRPLERPLAPAESDPHGVAVLEALVRACGGVEAWERAPVLAWSIGDRRYLWDRPNGLVRVERDGPDDPSPFVCLLALDGHGAAVWLDGRWVDSPRAREDIARRERLAFEDAALRIFLPWRALERDMVVRAHGVVVGPDGTAGERISLAARPDAPDAGRRYELLISRATGLVDASAEFVDDAPRPVRQGTWSGWVRLHGLLLATERGHERVRGLAAAERVPWTAFAGPGPVPWSRLRLMAAVTE